jgi:peroxiredoxin
MHSGKIALCLALFILAGCGTDLAPSATDKHASGQIAPDFTLSDTLGNSVTMSTTLASAKGVVLYFTMWCPVCDTDMTDMRDAVMPNYPNVSFFVIDYVSGTVADARNAEVSNGYDGSGFIVLADTQRTVLNLYRATMGSTVLIDRNGIIRMNEEYKSAKLQSELAGLP